MSHNKPVTLDELLSDVSSVPSLPLLYSRLDETINHPRSSIADIAKVLSEDQGLAARILKLANSPLFGYFSKIDTVTQAVTIIGIQQVRDLALAISVIGVFKGLPKDLVTMECFWRHSIGAALAARVLATSQREANLERFFVAGILHDIGRLLLFMRLPDLCREMIETARNSNQCLHELERQRLGYDHADVGGALLRRWKLPTRVTEPVEYHHRCNHAGQFPRESAILHCADLLAHALELGGSGEERVPPLIPGSWERLTVSPFQLPQIVAQIDNQLEEISKALGGAVT
ncbi:MAG: HDOD domain-containing protein [Desulfuromonadaceae bacterium]|nr:HDOD domain-containing protein [Desulfuromonadaceae bacterium]MDD5107532.1 HDOD domain-containing protein [Desulfuromonadaceae bacterium]